ncbi:MAG: hypothetical protein ACHP7D_07600 [Lysobacterales bacterium]
MKHLALAGISASERAELVKLFSLGPRSLAQGWALRVADTAVDLVLVDLDDFAGRVARVRALDEGVRFAVLVDSEADPPDASLVLRRPLTAAALAELLNAAARTPPPRRDAEDFAASAAIPAANALPVPTDETSSEPSTRARFDAPRSARPCSDFGALVRRGPLLIERAGLPSLAIDPVQGVYHADAPLSALEPYFLDVLKGRDCHVLGPARLTELRAAGAGQPLARLHWLEVLLRSNGVLAAHLDPGGSYRLRRWLPFDGDYRRYYRVAAAMLRPGRLEQIARTAQAPMEDVFDMVNACDAIGSLEWTPRRSRYAAPDAVASTALRDRRQLLAAALLAR